MTFDLPLYPKPTRTSYSALTTFEGCPLSYYWYYLRGFRDEGGQAAQRGTRLHTACELFLQGSLPEERLPIDFWKIKPLLLDFKQKGAIAEEVWLVDSGWNHQDEEDEHTRIKALTDIHYVVDDVLHVTDLKSGRNYPSHEEQVQLYAILGQAKYPHIEAVRVSALYIDDGVEGHVQTYKMGIIPHLRNHWEDRMAKLFEATEYPPTPSVSACRWCKLKAKNGGPCTVGI